MLRELIEGSPVKTWDLTGKYLLGLLLGGLQRGYRYLFG